MEWSDKLSLNIFSCCNLIWEKVENAEDPFFQEFSNYFKKFGSFKINLLFLEVVQILWNKKKKTI